MKGSNELVLNEATMMEALQEYLDRRMTTFAPRVTGVTEVRSGTVSNAFKVTVEAKETP